MSGRRATQGACGRRQVVDRQGTEARASTDNFLSQLQLQSVGRHIHNAVNCTQDACCPVESGRRHDSAAVRCMPVSADSKLNWPFVDGDDDDDDYDHLHLSSSLMHCSFNLRADARPVGLMESTLACDLRSMD